MTVAETVIIPDITKTKFNKVESPKYEDLTGDLQQKNHRMSLFGREFTIVYYKLVMRCVQFHVVTKILRILTEILHIA